MATLNPKTEVEALAARLRADAQDVIEARTMLFAAAMTLQTEVHKAINDADEAKAALVVAARAALVDGKSAAEQTEAAAGILGKHPSAVSAIEVLEVVVLSSPESVK